MERLAPGLAECLSYYIADNGFERADHLSDAAHKKLIRRQWTAFNTALRVGLL